VPDSTSGFQDTPSYAETPGGRRIAYSVYGAPQGQPVFYCHGFPSSRREALLLHDDARAAGASILSIDRPGYGDSDDQHNRTLTDWSDDVACLADRLDLDRFSVLGVSGGGPYALACAWRIPERVRGCALVCPLGPIYIDDLLKRMNLAVRLNLSMGRRPIWLANLIYGGPTPAVLRRWPGLVERVRSIAAPPRDREVLAERNNAAVLNRTIADAMRQRAAGARRDLFLYAHDWGIPFGEIGHQVRIWHGRDDGTVPIEHARWYAAHLAHARLTEMPGHGHYSVPLRHGTEILAALLTD
jgi:pimeloyl-ACP methyl ester carboxylesterase